MPLLSVRTLEYMNSGPRSMGSSRRHCVRGAIWLQLVLLSSSMMYAAPDELARLRQCRFSGQRKWYLRPSRCRPARLSCSLVRQGRQSGQARKVLVGSSSSPLGRSSFRTWRSDLPTWREGLPDRLVVHHRSFPWTRVLYTR